MDPFGYGAYFGGQKPPAPPPIAKGPPAGFNYGWGAPPSGIVPGGPYVPPGTKSYGANCVTPGMLPVGHVRPDPYGGWVPPPTQQHQQQPGGAFPKKTRGFNNNGGPRNNGHRGFKRPFQQDKKPYDAAGKTPAMLLHELFKDIQEKFEEVTGAKKYRCVLIVNGSEFSMEANSKKIAKQKAAELAVRALRPDIPITPYEETTPAVPLQPKIEPHEYAAPGNYQAPPLIPAPPQPAKVSTAPPNKKAKLPAVQTALSLVDALRKLGAENAATGPYNPRFDFSEVPNEEHPEKKKFKCVLTFADIGKIFVYEGLGRTACKDMVCLQALKDLFDVTEADIRAIMRRHVLGKGGDMPIVQTMYHVANTCHCSIVFKLDTVEDEQGGIGTGKQRGFTCECTLTDHTRNDKEFVFKSDICQSKHEAKEDASLKALREHFNIDPVNVEKDGDIAPVPPCQQLSVMCARTFKRNDILSFEDLGAVGIQNTAGYGFKSKCTVNQQEFTAIGPSKKAAKNAAALKALETIFPSGSQVPVAPPVSEMCLMVYHYITREYENLANYFNIAPNHHVASFMFVNEKNEKRLVSVAACRPQLVKTEFALGAEGNCLYHCDPIVLARRSLVKYIMSQLEKPAEPNSLFVKGEDGMFRLKENIRLVLYANFSPSIAYSSAESPDKALTILGSRGIEAVGSNVLTAEDWKTNEVLKVHSPADKIFKWAHLGVQGTLLSTIMHPVLLDMVFFGSVHSNQCDADLKYSFYNRLGPETRPVVVESVKQEISQVGSPPHIYTRDVENIEILGQNGRTQNGTPSILCKAQLYEHYLKLNPSLPKDTPYLKAKANAVLYNESKKMLYEKLDSTGYGVWQSKPAELVDFTLQSA